MCTASRTAAFGSSGGWPPKTVAQHTSGTTAVFAFLPCRSLESDPCHTSHRPHPSVPTQLAPCNSGQWSTCTSTDLSPTRPYLASDCFSASLRFKHHHVPALEPSVLGPRLLMEGKNNIDDTETSACPKRHPGTPVGALVEIFRRHVPQPISYDENELYLASVEEPAACGAEGPQSMPCTSPTVTLPLSSTPPAASTHRQRSGQVPRPSQAPHIRVFSSTSRGKACRVTPPETMSSSSSSIRITEAIQQDDAHHTDPPLGWLPEDDALLDIGGRVEQPSETSGVAQQLPEGRLSKACAKNADPNWIAMPSLLSTQGSLLLHGKKQQTSMVPSHLMHCSDATSHRSCAASGSSLALAVAHGRHAVESSCCISCAHCSVKPAPGDTLCYPPTGGFASSASALPGSQ